MNMQNNLQSQSSPAGGVRGTFLRISQACLIKYSFSPSPTGLFPFKRYESNAL